MSIELRHTTPVAGLHGEVGDEAFAKFYEPSRLIADICVSEDYTDFLTLPAYELVS
jgi:malate synthase